MKTLINIALWGALLALPAHANDFSYNNIAKRYGTSALNQDQIKVSRMQGECLVGLKELNFKKKNTFDPVAEWTSYRSVSLLEQYSPCEVLIIMEVAQRKLKAGKANE